MSRKSWYGRKESWFIGIPVIVLVFALLYFGVFNQAILSTGYGHNYVGISGGLNSKGGDIGACTDYLITTFQVSGGSPASNFQGLVNNINSFVGGWCWFD